MKSLLKKLRSKPSKLFIIDGVGALFSAFMLGYVLVKFESLFGIPSKTLYLLASLPIVFASYDFYAVFSSEKRIKKLLKGIAALNVFYCLLSLFLAIYHINELTIFGWTYILIEILIILFLVLIEISVANRLYILNNHH